MPLGCVLREFADDELGESVVILMLCGNSSDRPGKFLVPVVHEHQVDIGAEIQLLPSKFSQAYHRKGVIHLHLGRFGNMLVAEAKHRINDPIGKGGKLG